MVHQWVSAPRLAIDYSATDTINDITQETGLVSGVDGPTTSFQNEVNAVISEPAVPSRGHNSDARDWASMTIRDMVSQPILLQTFNAGLGSWSKTQLHLPTAIFEASPFIKDKLKGYYGLKADITIRMVVNSDKHTQGRLIMFHSPPVPQNMVTHNFFNHTYDHQVMTQLPNVQLDINTETEAILKVPWCGPYAFFNLLKQESGWGSVTIRRLLPLRGSEISVSLFASFDNVELIGPTSTKTYYSQGNLNLDTPFATADENRIPYKRTRKESVFYHSFRLMQHFLCYKDTIYKSQSNLDMEKKNTPLSARLSTLSSVATAAAGVPLLTSIFEPVAWATAISSKIMSAFGYSKPLSTKSAEVRVVQTLPGINHHDGVDWAETLALSGQACVQGDPNLGATRQDEMSIKFLTQVKSSIHRFQWATTDIAGTKLISIPLSPKHMSARSGHWASGDAFVAHPINFISQTFEFYRGSFEITLVFSKTIFHTGRLMLVYEPGNRHEYAKAAELVGSIDEVNPCQKDIVDIRTSNSISVVCPFMAPTPYLHRGAPYGFLHVFVVNPLVRNTENVNAIVDIMVFAKGTDDWEFNGPTEPLVWPFKGNRVAPASGSSEFDRYTHPKDEGIFESQGGLELDPGDAVGISKPIGTCQYPTENMSSAPLCMGERVLSVKQMMMRSKEVSKSGRNMVKDPFGIDPFFSNYTVQTFAAQNPEVLARPYYDWMSYFGSLYAFNRGGVILTVVNNTPFLHGVSLNVEGTAYEDRPVEYKSQHDLQIVKHIPAGESCRLYIPPYQRGLCRYTYPSRLIDGALEVVSRRDAGVSNTRLRFFRVPAPGIEPVETAQIPQGIMLFRSAAEDTQFGFFTGVPLMMTAQTDSGVIDHDHAYYEASSADF